ncbi:MAG TPA: AAA family ATPase, partial [Actinomycetota bacterium]|nr:AAA family ATPase [Actinomycetota bacterium]
MFLRSLTIRGFKSFADRTVLEFGPGVAAIVGPNGSGKSNLVDAISWVLGEQGPRALRGGQMADVIFAGSPERPALGMAEVRLVIDNSAGLIPVPMTEIEVSRTIFRSGESEYRIGGQVVRLLDVQELLSESGIGRALHTVVGQGQLEEVLAARPEERRRYIEEAAGIAKHRRRKERAERKLAGLEQDLVRLQDVLGELRRQLRPLKQQAEVARRHEELTAQAEELSWRLAAARLRDLAAERDRRRGGWEEGLALREAARRRLQELDEEVGRLADGRVAATARLREAEARLREAADAEERASGAARKALEREARLRAELADHATRAARLGAVEEELARAEADLARVDGELAGKERELEAAEAEFRERERLRRAVEEERRRLTEEAAARRAQVETIRGALAAAERDRERLERSLEEVRARIGQADREREGLGAEIERLDAAQTPLAERRDALEAERRGLVDAVGELEEAVRRQAARRDLLAERLRDLEETPGGRFLQAGRSRALGLLLDLVRAEEGLERALLAALGPFADAVVYADADAALADAPEGDGAILAVASGGPGAAVIPGERSLLHAVRADPEARGLVSTLLGDVYLAADLAEAAEKRRRHPRASFVTPEGVLVGPLAIHTARRGDDRAREIRAELRVLEHDLAAARQRLRPKRERLDRVTAELDALGAEIEATDAEIGAAAERMAAAEREAAAGRREEEVLLQRLAGLDDARAAYRERLAAAGSVAVDLPELPRPADPPVRLRVEVEAARRDLAAIRERLGRLRAEREALRALDAAALEEELVRAEADRAAAEEELRTAAEAARRARSVRDEAAEAERGATEAEAEANRRWR